MRTQFWNTNFRIWMFMCYLCLHLMLNPYLMYKNFIRKFISMKQGSDIWENEYYEVFERFISKELFTMTWNMKMSWSIFPLLKERIYKNFWKNGRMTAVFVNTMKLWLLIMVNHWKLKRDHHQKKRNIIWEEHELVWLLSNS